METPSTSPSTQTEPSLPTETPLNARESKKSMYLIAGIIVALLLCLTLSFLLLSQILSF
jgi:hypothetical protein